MYNRYVPQSDGSFRHSRHPDQTPPPQPPKPEESEQVIPPEAPAPEKRRPSNPPRYRQRRPTQDSGLSFLRQLLPRDFDTTDLLVVVLLLLMSGDNSEDQNTALLTLALYLFL